MPVGTLNGTRRAVVLLSGRFTAIDTLACRTCTQSGLVASRRRNHSTTAAPQRSRYSTVASAVDPSGAAIESIPPASFPQPSQLTPEQAAELGLPTAVGTKTHSIKAGLLLSRTPRITRDLTPFEKAFFFYQRRLNERLALPFTKYFYYKRGTPQDTDYKRKVAERLTPSRDIGRYSAYGKEAWNDELLVGAPESEPAHQIEALVEDAQKGDGSVAEAGAVAANADTDEVPRPLSRVTKADLEKDYRSLDRELQRTVYLLFKAKNGDREYWQLPTVTTSLGETLKALGRPNVNAWIVGNHPIGHRIYTMRNPTKRRQLLANGEKVGYKEFFLKGRILAGQADLSLAAQDLNITDFRWLTKEEVKEAVGRKYWADLEGMFAADR